MSRHAVVSKVEKDGDECQSHLPPCDSRNQGSITTTASTAKHAAEGSAKREHGHFCLNHVTRSAWDFVLQLCNCGLVCGICTWPQPQGISSFLLPIPHIQEAIAACSSQKPSYHHWCGGGGGGVEEEDPSSWNDLHLSWTLCPSQDDAQTRRSKSFQR